MGMQACIRTAPGAAGRDLEGVSSGYVAATLLEACEQAERSETAVRDAALMHISVV
jgi:hypothetical protein